MSEDELHAVYVDLMEQWLANHSEHCGFSVPPWPHKGICNWPLPPSIASLSLEEIRQLLAEVS